MEQMKQLDLFSISTSNELKNLRRWVKRLERRIYEMEMRQKLIEHAKSTGFRLEKLEEQLEFFGT